MNENNKFLPAKLPSNESRRLEAVKRTGELDVDNKDLFIVFNELAKQISNMPVSYTALMDQDRQFFLCHIGMPDDLPDSIPRESTFCQFALGSTKPLIVKDCKNDERFKNHPIVCGPPYVTFYGGFPIINEAGYILGTLCVTDTKQDANLSVSQIELLTKLTGRLAHQLDIQIQQREFTALSQLLFMFENPRKAAKVIEDGLNQGIVKAEEKTLKAAAQYWHSSKELERAKPYYKKAAKASKEGELYIFLGQVHFSLDEFSEAEEAIRAGIKKGKLKDAAAAHMLLGKIAFENQKWESAIASFRECIDVAERQYDDKKKKQKEKKKKVQDQARKWVTYTEGEEERVEALILKKRALGI